MVALSNPPWEPATGPRCEHRFPTSHYHQCRLWSVTTCELCDRAVRPATRLPSVRSTDSIAVHAHIQPRVIHVTLPAIHTSSRWPSVSYHACTCGLLVTVYRCPDVRAALHTSRIRLPFPHDMRQVLEGGPVHAHTMYSTSPIRVVATQHTTFMANEHTHRITHVLLSLIHI